MIFNTKQYGVIIFLLFVFANFAMVYASVLLIKARSDSADLLGVLGSETPFTELDIEGILKRKTFIYLASAAALLIAVGITFDNHLLIFSYLSSNFYVAD